MHNASDNLNVPNIDDAIQMLSQYADEPNIKPLLSILEALKQDIDNPSLQAQLHDTWRNLGVYQGTVLTYAPLFYTLIPDDIFGDEQ